MERDESLEARPSEPISPAPYLARQSWIRLEDSRVLPRKSIEELLRESYELVAEKLSRRRREALGVARQ